ncbi:MAG: hypothetical protein L0Z49_11915 [Actinobacteria bacterium]|nr:hypothetical protein [Actinomycetota bacterium]
MNAYWPVAKALPSNCTAGRVASVGFGVGSKKSSTPVSTPPTRSVWDMFTGGGAAVPRIERIPMMGRGFASSE